MTQAQAVELLRELQALERLAAAITRPDHQAPEWGYALPLIDDRVYWLRACVSQADPVLMASAEHLRQAALLWPAAVRDQASPRCGAFEPDPSEPVPAPSADLSKAARIH